MNLYTSLLSVFLLDLINLVYGQNQQMLYDYLFKNYRKQIRPINYENPSPTNVTVQLFVKQIQKVEESDQILTLYCWLEMYWVDEHLKWDEKAFNGTNEIVVPASNIWKPDLLVYNNANMNVQENELETNAVIKSNGRVSVYRAIVTQITCELKMENFPFDQQICFIMLSSWSYDGSGIMLDTLVPVDVDNAQTELKAVSVLTHYMPSAEWYLIDFKIQRNLKYYECCPAPYVDITYYFAIRRNPIYYLFTQLIPSTFICIVTIIGSFTPHSSTGENQEKITLGVTALLSLAIILMMVADKLPATSNDLPLLGKFYVGLIFIMFTATCCTTVSLDIQLKGNTSEQLPPWLRRFIRQNCIMRIFFKGFSRKPKGECRCLERSYSSSLLISPDDYCKLYAPPNPIYETSPIYHKILLAVNEIRLATRQAIDSIDAETRTKDRRREWGLVSRGLDRFFMLIFILFTIAYTFYLFQGKTADTLRITDEFMNRTANR